MEIIKLEKDATEKFRQLLEVFREAFEHGLDLPMETQLRELLHKPDFIVFTVNVNERVVGGLTLYVLKGYYSTRPVAYIYDVAIAPEWQRKGFGKRLLAEVCSYCKENGFDQAYVEAEADDLDAVAFYRSTKYSTEMQATHFTYLF